MAVLSATCVVPLTTPGGKPVTEVPGLRPRSPLITLGPVFVTVEPPKTAKLLDVPRSIEVAAKARPGRLTLSIMVASRVNIEYFIRLLILLPHFYSVFITTGLLFYILILVMFIFNPYCRI